MAGLAAFGQRLVRFDPGALIRVQSGRAWGQLPWGVLVCIATQAPDGVTAAGDGTARDAALWRTSLPPGTGRVVETVPASTVVKIAEAAAATLREMAGKAGERAIRDALLDHVAIQGESDVDGEPFAVSQRLIQGLVRMNFAGASNVEVLKTGPWTGLSTTGGQVWQRADTGLSIRPIVNQAIVR
jgi:hypothetical protein